MKPWLGLGLRLLEAPYQKHTFSEQQNQNPSLGPNFIELLKQKAHRVAKHEYDNHTFKLCLPVNSYKIWSWTRCVSKNAKCTLFSICFSLSVCLWEGSFLTEPFRRKINKTWKSYRKCESPTSRGKIYLVVIRARQFLQ